MKKITTIILFTLLALASRAGGPEYFEMMGKTLGEYAQCKNQDDFANLANKFNRIAQAEEEEWLPTYYHAHCLIIASFLEESDMEKKSAYLTEAEPSIEKILKMAPKNSDVQVLNALYYTAQLMVDPVNRGRKYSGLSAKANNKALKLDPQNPRAQYMSIQNDLGKAQFFGEDVSLYCKQAEEVLKHFDDYTPLSPLHPSWGKQDLKRLINTCE